MNDDALETFKMGDAVFDTARPFLRIGDVVALAPHVADLHGLGADWETYKCNSENVRREYEAFSDDEWVAGRRKFLNHMLVRNIFPPLPQYEALSDQAFSNMSDELNSLKG